MALSEKMPISPHIANDLSIISPLELPHRIHGAAIYGNIYHQYTPNVSIYPIHGSYGLELPLCVADESKKNSDTPMASMVHWLHPYGFSDR